MTHKGKKFRLASGKTLTVRLLDLEDQPHLLSIFNQMSPDSRYQRFLQVVDQVSVGRLHQETAKIIEQLPDPGNGLILFDGETAVGAARYIKVDDQTAEIALSIVDQWQGQGLGTHLLALLTELAIENNIVTLTGTVSNSNEKMWHILHNLPYPLTRTPENESSSICLDLSDAMLAKLN